MTAEQILAAKKCGDLFSKADKDTVVTEYRRLAKAKKHTKNLSKNRAVFNSDRIGSISYHVEENRPQTPLCFLV